MRSSEFELTQKTPEKNQDHTTAPNTPDSSPDSMIVIENPLHRNRAVNLEQAFNEVAAPQTNLS